MSITHESAFEANIETHLLGDGWLGLEPTAYDRSKGLFGDEVIAFVLLQARERTQRRAKPAVCRESPLCRASTSALGDTTEALRCLKRHLARVVFNLPPPTTTNLKSPALSAAA